MDVFKDYSYYYNAFYRDKDYGAEAKQVDLLLKKYGEKIERVINFGCGTGKHDVELCAMGYCCTGIDMSETMIGIAEENARREKLKIDFSVADVRDYEPTEKYDAVISLFHVMSYQNDNEDILAAFRSARKALRREGLFLFDVWYGPGVLSDKPTVRVKEVEDERYRLVRIARPVMYDHRDVVDVCYEVLAINKETGGTEMLQEVHSMRYFFRPEVEFYLRASGFELVEHLDCNTLGATDYDSWTCYFVARAV